MSVNLSEALDLAEELAFDPVLAHEVIFAHRHDCKTPDFHKELIELYHGENRNVMALAFRGSGKSTLAEETITLLAASGQVKNVLIIGESWTRAAERLRAIRRELETNEYIAALYGNQIGETWSDGKLVLANGCAITAHGQGQALRGMKHDCHRPDLCFVDDLESQDTVATPEARAKLSEWFWKDLLPVNHFMRLIIAATPLAPLALAVELSKLSHFKVVKVPIEYVDRTGLRQAAWPGKFPLEILDEMKVKYFRAGKQLEWAAEYMIQIIDPATRLFRRHMFKFHPEMIRTWEPVYIVYDPARTVKSTSATTGYVAASWVGRRLIIWEAGGARWKPSEIIEDIFTKEARYGPIAIGIEKDGLEEFLMEPIRSEQIRRSVLLPVRALKAPKGKLDFIQRLQPLFEAGDIIFAGPAEAFDDMVQQFLSYPTGVIDIPNAFAYLLEMRGGAPVYGDAHEKHVAEDLPIRPGPIILAVNAGPFGVAGVLFQYRHQILTILNAWVDSGDAGQALPSIIEEGRLYAGREITVVAPAEHFEVRNSFALRASLVGHAEVRKGGELTKGREFIRTLLRTDVCGGARLLIGPDATWARRSFFGGYCREDGRTEPRASLYATLAEALESAAGNVVPSADEALQMTAYTADGRPYKTAEVQYDVKFNRRGTSRNT